MITFNSLEEANNFKNWVNDNSPMLPILIEDAVETDGVFRFQETEDLLIYYNQYINLNN